MPQIFDAYDLPLDHLLGLYQRLNQVITYPDGMTTTLGILYWGRDQHLQLIADAIPKIIESGAKKLNDVLQAIRTPARAKKIAGQTGISPEILRILQHDLALWLPKPVPLDQIPQLQNQPASLNALGEIGLRDQLALISAGQTPAQREALALQTRLAVSVLDECVKSCDFYRSGDNLHHLRAKIYYEMGLDTFQKWAVQNSETVIARFSAYIQQYPQAGDRLAPWPKEVRNAIEWAKMHLSIYTVQW